ncbi:MAG: hypothetical protein IKR68_01425 [Lachnospiraceae bacterium]|nr:hypothetical protein [Lachnospiraceae bacterium]
MRYVLSDRQRRRNGGTDYLEFTRGDYDTGTGTPWKKDSVYVSAYDWRGIEGLGTFLGKYMDFDLYGISRCDSAGWDEIKKACRSADWEILRLVAELDSAVSDWLHEDGCFSVIGL